MLVIPKEGWSNDSTGGRREEGVIPRSRLGWGSGRDEERKVLPWEFHGWGKWVIGVEERERRQCGGNMRASNQREESSWIFIFDNPRNDVGNTTLGQPVGGASRRARAGDQGYLLRANTLSRGHPSRSGWLVGEERSRRWLATMGVPTRARRPLGEWMCAGGRR